LEGGKVRSVLSLEEYKRSESSVVASDDKATVEDFGEEVVLTCGMIDL
jgi:hypothetical protein